MNIKNILILLMALGHLHVFSLSENVGEPVKKWAVTQTLLSNGEVRLMGCESIAHKGLSRLENCEIVFSSWLEKFEFENVKSSSLPCVERPNGANDLYICEIHYSHKPLLSTGNLILLGVAGGFFGNSLTKKIRAPYGNVLVVGALVISSVVLSFMERFHLGNRVQQKVMSIIHRDNLQVGRPLVFIFDTERQQDSMLKFINNIVTVNNKIPEQE